MGLVLRLSAVLLATLSVSFPAIAHGGAHNVQLEMAPTFVRSLRLSVIGIQEDGTAHNGHLSNLLVSTLRRLCSAAPEVSSSMHSQPQLIHAGRRMLAAHVTSIQVAMICLASAIALAVLVCLVSMCTWRQCHRDAQLGKPHAGEGRAGQALGVTAPPPPSEGKVFQTAPRVSSLHALPSHLPSLLPKRFQKANSLDVASVDAPTSDALSSRPGSGSGSGNRVDVGDRPSATAGRRTPGHSLDGRVPPSSGASSPGASPRRPALVAPGSNGMTTSSAGPRDGPARIRSDNGGSFNGGSIGQSQRPDHSISQVNVEVAGH